MQKIVPHLWFDTEAEEAVNFYTSLFDDSQIGQISHYGKEGYEVHGMPEGTVLTVEFNLAGYQFVALNGGPHFTFTPAISFTVSCDSKEEVDALWSELSKEGNVLMDIGEYPFSPRYGWVEDRYGLSWQIILVEDGVAGQKITPTLLFVGDVAGKAEEAINFYTAVFDNSEIGDIFRYDEGEEPDREGTIKYADFTLEGQKFAAMDSAREHDFSFNEAVSLMVLCRDQKEIDRFWKELSAVPEAEQCGWLKDKYGVSWQITPKILGELMGGEKEKSERVMKAFLPMKKLDIKKLQEAYNT